MNRRHPTPWTLLSVPLVLAAASAAQAGPGHAGPGADYAFRYRSAEGPDLEVRPYTFGFDYFLQIYTYTPRLLFRWMWDDGWENTAVGYTITAGSLTSDDLYVDQRARVRVPITDWLGGQFEYLEAEDYDGRLRLAEVELVFRVLRPEGRAPLTATPGWTPRPDGFFFGGTGGVLDRFKEYADIGFVAGYRNDFVGVRVDLIRSDWFYDEKVEGGAEYRRHPHTINVQTWLRLLEGRMRLSAWYSNDTPLDLRIPAADQFRLRYRQVRAGGRLAWHVAPGLRLDLSGWGEWTRRHQTEALDPSPEADVDLEREGGWVLLQVEKDVPPIVGSSASLPADTWLFNLFVHRIDERINRPAGAAFPREVMRRSEVYPEVGYVFALPSFADQVGFGARLTAAAGFLSIREINQDHPHRVSERFLAKVQTGVELHFRDGHAFGLLQLTWLVSEPAFGGGNAQVQMTF